MTIKALVTASVLALALPFAASAKNMNGAKSLITGDAEAIAELAEKYGSASTDIDDWGDPMVRGTIGGKDYIIYFYGCEEQMTGGKMCTNMHLTSYWGGGDLDLEDVNAWNRDNRSGKAYIDSDGDPTLEWNVNLLGGVSEEMLDDTLRWWSESLSEFGDLAGN